MFTLVEKVVHQTRQKDQALEEASQTAAEQELGIFLVARQFQELVEVLHQFELEMTATTTE